METEIFSGVLSLKKRLPINQEIEVVHNGHAWQASFRWSNTADPEFTQKVANKFHGLLPKDYLLFLEKIANGAILFYYSNFGQWGFEIYGTDTLVSQQSIWAKSFPNTWSSRFIAFCGLFGEAHAMVFDLSKPSRDGLSYAILETDPIDPIDEWRVASRSFHEWLNHLITAQGDKYWEWY